MANMFMPPAIPALTIAGRVFTDLQNLIQLRGFAEGTTTVRCSMRKQNASAGYQVPVGKKFVVCGIRCRSTVSASNANLMLLLAYSDNDTGVNSSTAFTNAVYLGGSSNLASLGGLSEVKDDEQEFTLNFEVPAGKYLGMQVLASAANSVSVDVFGYEVPA